MIKFGQFMKESEEGKESLPKIYKILDAMTSDEIYDFGIYLYLTFFDSDDTESDEGYYFDVAVVKEMLEQLPPDLYVGILEDLEEDDDTEDETSDGMDESMNRVMLTKNINRKRRKYMAKSKSDLRREYAERMRNNRLTLAKRKRYYRMNKAKIASYQKSRREYMEQGAHYKKVRSGK